MTLKSIEQAEIEGKRVLVRVDFNVEMDDLAHVQETYKLMVCRKTIDYLFAKGAVAVALLTHYGRPEGTPDPQYSLSRLQNEVSRFLERDVRFVDDCIGMKVSDALDQLPKDSVLLLENVRFYPGEDINDEAFARALAAPFHLFVNEAFSVCHRAHASVTGIPAILPSVAGFHVINEVESLTRLLSSPQRPAVAIIGGAKIETKLPLIRAMEERYDCVMVGGKIANEALDQKIQFSEKVLLPQDFDSEKRLDIGPKTATYYSAIIQKAQTIVWNGPMGKFEEKPYDFGTNMILQAILNSPGFVVIGGGESLAVLERAGVYSKIGFVSSGGGAMLEFLSGRDLPGLRVLENK